MAVPTSWLSCPTSTRPPQRGGPGIRTSDAASGPAGRAGCLVRPRVHEQPDVCALAALADGRAVRAPDRGLGQRSDPRAVVPHLGSPAARGRLHLGDRRPDPLQRTGPAARVRPSADRRPGLLARPLWPSTSSYDGLAATVQLPRDRTRPRRPRPHQHDVAATDAALEFLRDPGPDPFLLYVGYMHPHFPLVRRRRSALSTIRRTSNCLLVTGDQHPVISLLRHGFHNDEPLTEEQVREATACYWALISHLDHQVGRLLEAVPDDTVVIYTSDHGEMAGHHGIWQKQCFYEPAVRIPLLLRHPSVQPGRTTTTSVWSTYCDTAGHRRPAAGSGAARPDPARSGGSAGVVGVPRAGDGRRRFHAEVRPVEVLLLRSGAPTSGLQRRRGSARTRMTSRRMCLWSRSSMLNSDRSSTPTGSTYSRNPTRPRACCLTRGRPVVGSEHPADRFRRPWVRRSRCTGHPSERANACTGSARGRGSQLHRRVRDRTDLQPVAGRDHLRAVPAAVGRSVVRLGRFPAGRRTDAGGDPAGSGLSHRVLRQGALRGRGGR